MIATKSNNSNYSVMLNVFLKDVKVANFIGINTYTWFEEANDLEYLIRMHVNQRKVLKMWRKHEGDNWKTEKEIDLKFNTIEEIALDEWLNNEK